MRAYEVHKRTLKGGRAVADLISINLLEVMAMVMTVFVMVNMRGERARRKGEEVLTRADNEVAVTYETREGRGVDEDNKGIASKGRVVFPGKACAEGRQQAGRRSD